ncbi:phosphate ABC transporter permease [Vibrio sp. 10N.286.49.B3]|uniref:ABC transporter permease subunit n=1 Tax=Vibrio sp. 10N.286.49.B3 TaxID=1880855 RepID=UPI000C8288C9|nr:ABC transporter permease subunit [Vibrio sp. 10N.286.49.B3]PMH37579.1 phosphate ABC transporter permease [Vibrio sp. 10N.286.49.B3]
MASAEFSLQERDQKRLIKDRLVRFAVTCGGVGVLAALVLIFVYLALVVLPIFSDASIETDQAQRRVFVESPQALAIDEYGLHAYTLNVRGQVGFWDLKAPGLQADYRFNIMPNPTVFAQSSSASGWFALANESGAITIFSPKFTSLNKQQVERFSPSIKYFQPNQPVTLTDKPEPLQKLAIAVNDDGGVLAGLTKEGQVAVKWFNQRQNYESGSVNWYEHSFHFEHKFKQLDQLLLTPDGQQLFLLSGSDLIVAIQDNNQFTVREVVDLSEGSPEHSVKHVDLLSGAYSLLVTHNDGRVSQWFDVLKEGNRHLTSIRSFALAPEIRFLLPDTYRKGFYSFYKNGTIQSHYTTSEKLVLFKRAFEKAPDLAAMSNNELHLATLVGDQLSVAKVSNDFPEISFSSLWKKVWYESYPEPEFVWQSTSASNDFEAKFSLVPIVFGTLKAAVFAMLFSIPIAVLGAIYTAYFMSERMRRVVKPSIELMEALPTVIIGFLAGLWFAPIVESHLTAVMLLFVLLPLSMVAVGALWHSLPRSITSTFSNGWHALILVPVLVLTVVGAFYYSDAVELWLFAGDVQLFLAGYGIDFDQRNALVVGFAMGFAVIPTIFTIAEDAIFSVPKHLSDGSLALGATPWQTLIYVVLLTASPGIFSAIMMGLGRAVGETMIVLMATGNTPIMDWNILEGMRTLSATIAVELPESEVGSSHYRLLFLAALLLFIFTFAVNSLAEWVRQRLRERYRAL